MPVIGDQWSDFWFQSRSHLLDECCRSEDKVSPRYYHLIAREASECLVTCMSYRGTTVTAADDLLRLLCRWSDSILCKLQTLNPMTSLFPWMIVIVRPSLSDGLFDRVTPNWRITIGSCQLLRGIVWFSRLSVLGSHHDISLPDTLI